MVAVLLGNSLFAESIGRQLMRSSVQLDVLLVDVTAGNVHDVLGTFAPNVIILDEDDTLVSSRWCLINQLMRSVPRLKIIFLDSQTQATRVVYSGHLHVNKVKDLVQMIERYPA